MAIAARRRFTLKHWIILGGIEAAFTVFYFGFIWPNMPIYPPLGRFVFPENEWFDAPDIEITDPFSDSPFVIANDELFYNIKYTNKKPFPILIQPEIQVLYGGDVIHSVSNIEPVILGSRGQSEHHVRFFIDRPGINQVVFKVKILNTTSSTLLGVTQVTYNVKVLSVEASQQLEQNKIAFWGVLTSIVAAIASIYIGIGSVVLTRKQMSLQLRPWIGPDTSADPSHRPMTRIGFYHTGGVEVPDRVFETNTAEQLNEVLEGWNMWVKNHGNIPASNIQTRVRPWRGPNRPNIEDVMLEPPSVPSSLMMGEQMSVQIGVPAPWIKQENANQRIFVSIRITYTFGDGPGRYDLIAQYRNRNFVVEITQFR